MAEPRREESPEELAQAFPFLPPRAVAIMAAMQPMFTSAVDGECKDCPCDVCVSVRGIIIGVVSLIEDDVL